MTAGEAPRFYDVGGDLFCEWHTHVYRVIEVEGERFLIPAALWRRKDLQSWITRALERVVLVFKEALNKGVPYEDARYLLPEGSLSILEFSRARDEVEHG